MSQPTPPGPDPAGSERPVVFGAAVRGVSSEVALRHRLPAPYGVEVGEVRPGSVAEAAGIRTGDIITAVGGYTLQGGADLFRQAVAARRPGDTMQLTVWREGRGEPVAVQFPAEPPAPAGS